jgi:hypothetical protein
VPVVFNLIQAFRIDGAAGRPSDGGFAPAVAPTPACHRGAIVAA